MPRAMEAYFGHTTGVLQFWLLLTRVPTMRSWLYSQVLFPLTPALSLRERENSRLSVGEPEATELFESQTPRLPLPKGEGWGEGEDNAGIAKAAALSTCV